MSAQPKICLVTGSNKGIGKAIVKGLLEGGHSVVLTARSPEKGKAAAAELRTVGDVHFHQLDVTDPDSVRACADFVADQFGRLDVLVNNAGINYDTWQNVLDADIGQVEQTINTNTLGPYRTTQALLPLLRKSDDARVINVSSGGGDLSAQNGNTPAYSLSKFALNGLSRALATRLKGEGITVNLMGPGWVRTDMGGSGAGKSPAQGADTAVWLATDAGVKGATGKFYRERREVSWI